MNRFHRTERCGRPISEVELRADLRNAARNECLCVLPRRVEGAHTQNRVSIEGVEQVEVHCRPRPPEAEQFADTEVDLIQPLAIQRRWLDHVDVHRLGTARETPPETGYDLGVRIRAGCR